MLVIQRIRVTWRADERGAAHADLRRQVPKVLPLPEEMPDDAVVVHDVVASSLDGYRFSERVRSGDRAAYALSLDLSSADGGVTVHLAHSSAVYPRSGAPRRLFTLSPGETALYLANFRFRGCQCSASWWYEDWTINVAHAAARSDVFLGRTPHHLADHRVNLYGGHHPKRTGSVRRR
ncbi:hypothetical protein [Catellatospora tritici]|uniref:hypothetical protein n=1 Tax=Catellatospora tritici TaxID=2851566 RepID=UPI001C2D68E3|nr:hypothetical protein [Catellatospora tritici]MBV1856501.1 hypothetical protein [Catellatospora tritici]